MAYEERLEEIMFLFIFHLYGLEDPRPPPSHMRVHFPLFL